MRAFFPFKKLLENELTARLLNALLGSAGLRVAGMGFGFLVGLQLARGLGAEGYGVYGVAVGILSLLTVPTEFGLPQLLTREAACSQATGQWGRLRGAIRWSTRIVVSVSLLLVPLMIAGVWLGPGFENAVALPLMAGLILVPAVALGNLRSAVLRGLQYVVAGQAPEAVVRPAVLSALLLLAGASYGRITPTAAILLSSAAAGVALLAAALMLRRVAPPELRTQAEMTAARAWRREAIPMALTEGMRVLQGHLMVLLLGAFSTAAAVGVYRLAAALMLLAATPITLMNLVVSPMIARLHARGERGRLQHVLTWAASGMTVGCAALTLLIAVAGEETLTSIFGDDFRGVHGPLLVLCSGCVASSLFGSSAGLLNMSGHPTAVTRASAISLAILVVFGVPLAWTQGSTGAAWASALALVAWQAILWQVARRRMHLDTSLLSIVRGTRRAS